MQKTSGASTCSTGAAGAANGVNTNALTCTTIHNYGGVTPVPGGSVTTSEAIRNTGTVPTTAAELPVGDVVTFHPEKRAETA